MAYFRTGGGTDTSDANATAGDILISKTAYVNDEKITGTMANNGDISHNISAGEVYVVSAGYTSGGTITATAAGATITVSYTSDFYNKTMTCTKGQTTYTQTTTSSGSTTFSVAESGTWTITCNGVSRTVDVVLEYTTQMVITKTITVYSAASDTVSFTDVTGAKTCTTDTSGQGSVSISFIPPSQNITFTSSVAKNPDDLSQYYSKTVSITNATTEVYVMPDGAIYWYGYNNSQAGNIHYTSTPYSYTPMTYNTNSMGGHPASDSHYMSISSKTAIDITNYTKLRLYGKHDYDYTYFGLSLPGQLNAVSIYNTQPSRVFPTTLSVVDLDISSYSGNYWVGTIRWLNTYNHEIHALWLE